MSTHLHEWESLTLSALYNAMCGYFFLKSNFIFLFFFCIGVFNEISAQYEWFIKSIDFWKYRCMKTKMYILIKFYSIVVSEGMVCTYKRFKKKSQVIIYLNLCSHCPFSFLPKADCCFPLLRARYYRVVQN